MLVSHLWHSTLNLITIRCPYFKIDIICVLIHWRTCIYFLKLQSYFRISGQFVFMKRLAFYWKLINHRRPRSASLNIIFHAGSSIDPINMAISNESIFTQKNSFSPMCLINRTALQHFNVCRKLDWVDCFPRCALSAVWTLQRPEHAEESCCPRPSNRFK